MKELDWGVPARIITFALIYIDNLYGTTGKEQTGVYIFLKKRYIDKGILRKPPDEIHMALTRSRRLLKGITYNAS